MKHQILTQTCINGRLRPGPGGQPAVVQCGPLPMVRSRVLHAQTDTHPIRVHACHARPAADRAHLGPMHLHRVSIRLCSLQAHVRCGTWNVAAAGAPNQPFSPASARPLPSTLNPFPSCSPLSPSRPGSLPVPMGRSSPLAVRRRLLPPPPPSRTSPLRDTSTYLAIATFWKPVYPWAPPLTPARSTQTPSPSPCPSPSPLSIN